MEADNHVIYHGTRQPLPIRSRTQCPVATAMTPKFAASTSQSAIRRAFLNLPEEEEEQVEEEVEEEQAEESEEEEEEEEEEEVRVRVNSNPTGAVVTLGDPDLLDCPICLEPLRSPVYQCDSGHLACDLCCKKVRNKCPSCSLPIRFNRNRAIERVVESAVTSCVNIEHGCTVKVSYLKKLNHEKKCKYIPISCPHPGCKYIGMPKCFYTHFTEKHPYYAELITLNTVSSVRMGKDEEHVLLQEREVKILFVLRRVIDRPLGSFVNVCVVPDASDMRFSYDITARERNKSINLKTDVELSPRYFVQPSKEKCLLITKDFYAGPCNELDLEIVLWKKWVDVKGPFSRRERDFILSLYYG